MRVDIGAVLVDPTSLGAARMDVSKTTAILRKKNYYSILTSKYFTLCNFEVKIVILLPCYVVLLHCRFHVMKMKRIVEYYSRCR